MVALETKSAVEKTFAELAEHNSSQRVNTEWVVAETLRAKYPEYHVTIVAQQKCDLLGFAAAGYAETLPLCEDELTFLTRKFVPANRRVEQGSVNSDVRFARRKYTWQGTDFLVFEIMYVTYMWVEAKRFYILAPRAVGQIDNRGLHSSTESLVFAAGTWSSKTHNEIYVYDGGDWEKSKELFESVHGASWNDVILNPQTKESLIEDVTGFFDSEELYREFAVPWKRGLILHGMPGNGKTMSIKALIHCLAERKDSIPTLYVKSLKHCNGPQHSVRSIFDHARSSAPCLLVLEDLDSLIVPKVRSYFLNEVDGLHSNDGILMIGSTNHLSSLDPAIAKRPSRFDRKYYFDMPGPDERMAYCEYWKQKLANNKTIDFPQGLCHVIAKLTEGFTFAYMKELFVGALLVVARGGKGDDSLEGTASADQDEGEVLVSPPDSSGSSATEDDAAGKLSSKSKKALPEVEIPEEFRDNILLKVFMQQANILLTEMDSTEPEKWKSSVFRPDSKKKVKKDSDDSEDSDDSDSED